MRKNIYGITLIALVVTIVVLLILAGVSISMLTGNNGIITQAQNAKNKTEEAEEKEKIQLAVLDAVSKNNDLTEENLQKEIDDEFGSGETKVYENGDEDFSVIFQNKDTNYKIEDGEVTKIDIAFKIRDKEELQEFMEEVNGGNSFKDQYVYLLEDIDLENEEWGVIGSYTDDNTNKPFAGIFEGNNKKISGLSIISKEKDYVGLFAYNTGTIRDITLESGSITGTGRAGGISTINKGIIENCHNKGVNIDKTNSAGGITLENYGKITYCSNSADITSEIAGYVGGICGNNRGEGKISKSYNNGNIKAVYVVGGITGGNTQKGEIEYCYNLGDIVGTGKEKESDITHSGGISGNSFGKINSCYNVGNIEGEYSDNGGIAGTMMENGEITNCYNIGEIINKGSNLGNIVGAAHTQSKINNCYFTREICNLNGVGGIGASTVSINIIEKTINYMKTNDFVKDLNKNEEVFKLGGNLNNGYPILNWQ